MPRTKSPPIHASSPSLALLGLSPQYLLSEQLPVDSFPFLHLPSLPSLNSPPYSCLRTCIKSHGALAHNPLATFLPTHHKIVYKAAHDLALTPVPLSSMTFQPPWPSLLLLSALTPAVSCARASLPSDHHQFDSFLQSDFRPNALPSRKTSLTLTSISKTTSLVSLVILYHIILALTLRSSYHTCDTLFSLLRLLSPLPF